MPRDRGLEQAGLVAQPGVDHFGDAGSPRRCGHHVGGLHDGGKRIAHRHRAAAGAHEGQVVLGVARGQGVVCRKTEIFERRTEARSLVDAVGEHHHGTLVEDDLQVEAKRADGIEHRSLVGLPGCDDDAAHRQGRNPLRFEALDKGFGRGRPEGALLLAGRRVEQRAVLRHHAVEEVEPGAHAFEVGPFTPCHHDEASAAALQSFESLERRCVDDPVVRDSAVVIGRERLEVMHAPVSSWETNVSTIENHPS